MKARKFQEIMGFISERDMLDMIDNNLIRGSTVRRRDVYMANDIYGPNTNSLKGKTVPKNMFERIQEKKCQHPLWIDTGT